MESKPNKDFKWEELPVRAAHHLFLPIGIRGVQIETIEAPIRGWQRLLLKLSRLATPKLHYVNLDLDVSRFPFGIEIGDVYQNRKGQQLIVTNFSEKGNRIKLKSVEPVEEPHICTTGEFSFMYHPAQVTATVNIAEKCYDDFKKKKLRHRL